MEDDNNNEKINISQFLSLKTLLPPSLPETGSEFDLTVSYAVSPDNFVILPQTGGAGGKSAGGVSALLRSLSYPDCPLLPGLSELTASMCEYYEAGAGQHDRLDNTRLDRFAAARLNNADWHRYGLPSLLLPPDDCLTAGLRCCK